MQQRQAQFEEDARLVSRVRAGDQAAFRLLFERHVPLVYRTIRRMLNTPEDAEDLTQEVFVRAYERLHHLKDAQAFQAWLLRMAVNLTRDHQRRFRFPTFSLSAPPPGSNTSESWQLPDPAPGPDARVENADLSARVHQALRRLSPDHRAVVILHHLEGLSLDEIAEIVGAPVGTIKSRLARARAELRDRLTPD